MVSAEILYRATPFRLDALLLGGVLALILRGPHAHLLLRAARIVTPIVLAALVFCALLLPSTRIWSRSYVYPTWIFTSGLTLVDLLAALLILLALQSGSSVYRLFKLRPLRWLGRISYGAYVLHDIPHPEYTRFALRHFPAHPTRAAALVALPTTILLAWLSFRFLESPFLNLKERWTISRDRSP
jgi:peptidoglycan/LPS O-acetylase OafA/YrhL